MIDKPAVSIITPTLNQAGFIQQTIDSVLNQSYPNIDYQVIDAGSDDGSQAILNGYGDRLSWCVQPGIGQSQAINQGWRKARGSILAWINSDDYYFPEAVNQIVAYFKEYIDVDMVYGKCDIVDSRGHVIRPYPTQDFDYKNLLVETENYIPQPAVFMRRRVLDKIGFLNENLDYVMDFEYWLRVGRVCRVEHFPRKLAALRLHSKAKSVAKLSQFGVELVTVYESIFSGDELSPELKPIKEKALANIYHRAADCSYWGKDYKAARRFMRISQEHQSWPPRMLWLWVLLGNIGAKAIGRFVKNPYFT